MSNPDNFNQSLNTLLASFVEITPPVNNNGAVFSDIENICIDTSSNRIGINTLDPSYSLHIIDATDYSGNIYVSEFTCISANINKLDISHIDVSSIIFTDTITGQTLDVSQIDVSSIVFTDTISGPTLDISSIININTISGINLLFDISKIDISGTIDLSHNFRPNFFIPSRREDVCKNQLYYDMSGNDGILMIKLS